jgi:outer membrane protein TolC
MSSNTNVRGMATVIISALLLLTIALPRELAARDLTLQQAIDIALNKTPRGGMIRGRADVAEMKYQAKKINFYVPQVSINGTLPTYSEDQSYRPFTSQYDKQLFKTRSLEFTSYLQASQSLVTGGVVTAQANLLAQDNRYPDTHFERDLNLFVNENTSQGSFNLTLQQPLLRPSTAKYELNNARDDFSIAAMTRSEEQSTLEGEVIDAYVNLLRLSVKRDLYTDSYESARLRAEIDSSKFAEGILSEEDFLLSASARLDAELAKYEVETQTEDQRRKLALLLNIDVNEELKLKEPEVESHFTEEEKQHMLDSWEATVPVRKAEIQYHKSGRNADYNASGHGLTGDLQASYSVGRQNISTERLDSLGGSYHTAHENVSTSGWSVALVMALPIWDGGSGRAEVEAARFEAEQSRLEYQQARQNTRAEVVNLVNQVDVSYRRLQIMKKQIELAANKLKIAQSRFDNGEISEITLLESEVFVLDSRDKYLEELNKYLTNRATLEGMFLFDSSGNIS